MDSTYEDVWLATGEELYLLSTVKMPGRMSNEQRETLRRVEQNDETLDELSLGYNIGDGCFDSSDGNDYSTLGRFIGENTHLTKLYIKLRASIALDVTNRDFFEGIKRSSSIRKSTLVCNGRGVVDGLVYEILKAYHENSNLTHLRISYTDFQNGGGIAIAEILRGCTNLQEFMSFSCNITDEQLLPVIEAIRGLTSLVELNLYGNIIGNGGCETLATLLRDSNSNLHSLELGSNAIDNDGAIALTNSLSNNTNLRELYLQSNPIDQSVVDIFARLFCNTTSISSTFSSNHTLERLVLWVPRGDKLNSLLRMNENTNKSRVAIKKILKYHPSIDMEPFFEWNMEGDGERDLKALPYVVAWIERAQEAVADIEECESYNIDARKLTAMYQFAQAMPLLFVPASQGKGGSDNKRKRGS